MAKKWIVCILAITVLMAGCQGGALPIPAPAPTEAISPPTVQPEELPVQVSGVVQDVALSARVLTIQLAQEEAKFVALQDSTQIAFSDGTSADLMDIQRGDTIQAVGKPVGSDSLLAGGVTILRSSTKETAAAGSSAGQARILEAIASYREAADPGQLAVVLESLDQGIATYLADSLDPARPLAEQTESLEGLSSVLALGNPDAQVQVEYVNLSDQDLVLVDTALRVMPLLAFRWDGSTYVSYVIPPDFSLAEPEGWGVASGHARLERVDDINGDGRAEIVVTHVLYGASAANTRLLILRWGGEGFEILFDRMLVEWAGPAEWELTPAADKEEIKLSYVVLGVHDHKLLPHPTVTELWRWDGTGYIMVSYAQSPPETRREQFNLAEIDFQRRDYVAAIAAYGKVFQDAELRVEEETADVDWFALAHFRLGQCHTMLGQEERARRELEVAADAGPALGDLAQAFSNAYQSPDGVVRAWGALQGAGLYAKVYEGQAGNLGVPVDTFYLLFPGAGVAAYLDEHPEVIEQGGDELVPALGNLGLAIEGAAVADLDGDGEREVVFVTADDWDQHAWLAFRGGDRWLLDIAEVGESLSIGEIVPVGDGPRQAVTMRLPDNVDPDVVYVTWDGQKPVRLSDATSGEVFSEGSLLFQQTPGY